MEPLHLLGHFLIGLSVGFIFYLETGDPWLVVVSVLANFLIDLDHLFDYWVATGFNLKAREFFKVDYFEINKKVYVPFHSWELVVVIFLLSLFPSLSWIGLTISVSLFFHIVWDAFSYKINGRSYFLIWRFLHEFKILSSQ